MNGDSVYTPWVEEEHSLGQPQEKLLLEMDKQRFQAVTGNTMHPGQVSRHDIGYTVDQPERAPIPTGPRAHGGGRTPTPDTYIASTSPG